MVKLKINHLNLKIIPHSIPVLAQQIEVWRLSAKPHKSDIIWKDRADNSKNFLYCFTCFNEFWPINNSTDCDIDLFTFTIQSQKGKKCTQAQKALEPIHLSYGECVSVRLYRPNYCGVCTDGRCCSPRRTRTLPVTFVCPDGERFQRSAMFIQSCKCSDDCGHLNEVALPPQHWMYGDTHKFTD